MLRLFLAAFSSAILSWPVPPCTMCSVLIDPSRSVNLIKGCHFCRNDNQQYCFHLLFLSFSVPFTQTWSKHVRKRVHRFHDPSSLRVVRLYLELHCHGWPTISDPNLVAFGSSSNNDRRSCLRYPLVLSEDRKGSSLALLSRQFQRARPRLCRASKGPEKSSELVRCRTTSRRAT